MTNRRPPMNSFQKEDFIDLIRNGMLRFAACNQLNVTVEMVKTAYRSDPDFRLDLDEALLEATEPVENAVYKAAIDGDLAAAKWWLEHRDKERWGPQPTQVNVMHNYDGTELLQSVATLADELERRRAHAKAIETGGKIIEIEPERMKHPVLYEPGKAPVFHAAATRQGVASAKKKAKKMADRLASLPDGTQLPPRPGTGES